MELNTNEIEQPIEQPVEQLVEQPVEQPIVHPAVPVKTGGIKAMSIISKALVIIAFLIALASLFAILTIVFIYNFKFGFKVLNMSELNELNAVAPIYKSYALDLIDTSIAAMCLAIPALVLNIILKKKGFGSTFVLVFFIITMVVASIAICNCVLNYFLIGRYEIFYY